TQLLRSQLHGASEPGAGPGWTRDNDLDPVHRPNMLTRAKMKCVVRNIILDVRQQVFVGRDPQSRRTIFPLDLKCATGVDVRETADLSLLRFDMAVAADSREMAARNQTDTRSEYNHSDAFYAESHFYHYDDYDAPKDRVGFNKNSGEAPERAAADLSLRGAMAIGETAAPCGHCTIFIF